MAKQSKKHTILGRVKVSSKQLSKWGSSGGRPRKWKSEAERKRFEREKKKGKQLRDYRSYGEVKIKRYVVCPQCGKADYDLSWYFNEKGEYIPETWWWDSARGCKTNLQENIYHCLKCYHAFSFSRGEIKAEENQTIIKRAGSSAERTRRFRNKKTPKPNH